MSRQLVDRPAWVACLIICLALAGCQSQPAPEPSEPAAATTATAISPAAPAADAQPPAAGRPPAPRPDRPTPSPPAVSDAAARPFLALTELWSFAAGGTLNAGPLVANGTAYLAIKEGAVVALETETGLQEWRYAPPAGVWERSMALAGDLLVVGLPGQQLAGLDAGSGKERWRISLVGDAQRPALADGDTLYVGTAFVGPDLANDPQANAWLYALEATTGQVRWSLETGNYVVVTPAIFGASLYAAGSFFDPANQVEEGGPMRIYSLDAASGRIRWTVEGEAGLIKRLHADGERLHYLGYQDKLFALDAGTGRPAWEYHTENWTPDFTVARGILYFGSANAFVHALDPYTGRQLWRTNLQGTFNFPLGAPQRLGDTLYFQTVRQEVYALDANTGGLLWQARHDVPSRPALVVADARLFVCGRDGTLHVFARPK